jgi:hypothetical protein
VDRHTSSEHGETCSKFVEKCSDFLEKYFDPTEVLTSDIYLGLAQCLLEAFRECNKSDDFAAKYLNLVVGVVKSKLTDKSRSEKIKDHLRNLSKSRVELYSEWIRKYGVQVVGVETIIWLLKPINNEPLLQAFTGGVLKLSLILIPEVARFMHARYVRKIAVAIENLAKNLQDVLRKEIELEELGEKIHNIAYEQYEKLKQQRIFINTHEVTEFANTLRELREETFRSI